MVEMLSTYSKAVPGALNVVLIGPTEDEVQAYILDLGKTWSHLEFTLPVQTADGRWGVTGRVR